MHIRWQKESDHAFGYVNGRERAKYFVGYAPQPEGPQKLVADVRKDDLTWVHVDMLIGSVEHGIALCEAWEATGAY